MVWPSNGKTFGSGSRSKWVRYVQLLLVDKGYKVKVDGVYGKSTRIAVEAFQRRVGLPVTGKVDYATYARLTWPMHGGVIRKGTKGAWVGYLQRLLNSHKRHGKITVDGEFGRQTARALAAFYKANKRKPKYRDRVYSDTWVILNNPHANTIY